MDHIAGLVSRDIAKEFIELWQVRKPVCFITKLASYYCRIGHASGFCKIKLFEAYFKFHEMAVSTLAYILPPASSNWLSGIRRSVNC